MSMAIALAVTMAPYRDDPRPVFNRADYVLAGPAGGMSDEGHCRACGAQHYGNGYTLACGHPAAFPRDLVGSGMEIVSEIIPDDALPLGPHTYCHIVGPHTHRRPLVRWQ